MQTKLCSHFSLAPYIYATHFDKAVIILDGKSNKYLSLIDDAAYYFSFILKHKFAQNKDGKYSALNSADEYDKSNYWISYFIENNFIIHGTKPTYLAEPIKSGGLIEYRWDTKTSWKPFSEATYLEIIKAFFVLAKVHRIIKRKGTLGLIDLIKSNAIKQNFYNPQESEIKKLSAAVDAATILYPKKSYCLAWAATFTLLALKKNWQCSLVIGVQINPFYAHAWAECNDKVVHDDSTISQVLSIIFKEPYK